MLAKKREGENGEHVFNVSLSASKGNNRPCMRERLEDKFQD